MQGTASAVKPEDDDALLAELGVSVNAPDSVSTLKHVKPRAEIHAAEEIANRTVCKDFDRFKPLFDRVQKDLDHGLRQTRRFQRDAEIKLGDFFIVGGQKAYVAEMGEEFRTEQDRPNARLRVIFDNRTESNALLRSFQRALYKDEIRPAHHGTRRRPAIRASRTARWRRKRNDPERVNDFETSGFRI